MSADQVRLDNSKKRGILRGATASPGPAWGCCGAGETRRRNTVDLERRPVSVVTLADFDDALEGHTVEILRRWLDVRAGITKAVEGGDPRYLWIPTKPGRERAGVQPPKPGLTRAAVRTLHAAHRNLVLQVIGVPLRPYALLPHR